MGWARSLMALLLGHGGAPVGPPPPALGGDPEPAPSPPLLLDATTRTFWSHGAVAPATLVEAAAGTEGEMEPASRRVSAMLAAREGLAGTADRPRGDPAFSEAVFVELMRAGQHSRAFQLLTTECQRSWGSVEAFAAQHTGGVLGRIQGVEVKEVRYLPQWMDPELHVIRHHVAELDVEYALSCNDGVVVLPRTVHLLAAGGRWRSICYGPPRPGP